MQLEGAMRRFCHIASVMLGVVTLSACQTIDPHVAAEHLAAKQDATCRSWGHTKGTSGYANCRQTLHLQEERRNEQAIAYVERWQSRQLQPMQIDQSPPRSSLQCSTTMTSGFAQTNCY